MNRKERARAYAGLLVEAAGGEGQEGTLEVVVKEVLAIVIEKQERALVPEIIAQIESVWQERFGVASATVETAHPLSAALRTQLTAALHGASLKEEVRSELIGGMRLRLDDRVFDNTILGQLNALTQTLS